MRPSSGEREEINRIIMDELVYGVFKPEAIAFFESVITRMKDQGAVMPSCSAAPRSPCC